MYYSISRLSSMDVKWTGLFDAGNTASYYNDHCNPYYELIVVADGKIEMEISGKATALQLGESMLLAPWEQHRGIQTDYKQGKFYWVQFSCAPQMDKIELHRLNELRFIHTERTELQTVEMTHEDMLIVPRHHVNQQSYKLLADFEWLVDKMKQSQGYFRFQSTIILQQMLASIATEYLEQSHLDPKFPTTYVTFRNLVNCINNAYETDISSEWLEAHMGYKYEYLGQLFKKYTDLSITKYIQMLRMQRAKYLLGHTEYSIQHIAEQVGYQDPFYFSRLFKKMEGISPTQYQEMISEQSNANTLD